LAGGLPRGWRLAWGRVAPGWRVAPGLRVD